MWSPLTRVFGEWTLLLVQLFSIPIGAFGIFRLVLAVSDDRFLARCAMVCTLSFFGVITALGFDYHSSVVASMALPWFFLSLHQNKRKRSWLLLLFILSAKENMGLWLFVVTLSALFIPYLGKQNKRLLIAQSLFSLCWSLVVLSVIMPQFDQSGAYHQFGEYGVLGDNTAEVLNTVLARPLYLCEAVITDSLNSLPHGTTLKIEFMLVLLISGGWAMIKKWPFLIMATPILLQKMLHYDYVKWGLFAHYSIEFSVLAPLAIATVFMHTTSDRIRKWGAVTSTIMVVLGAAYTLHLPVEHPTHGHADHDRLRFFEIRHYKCDWDRETINKATGLIPSGAGVSALSPFVPHLINREKLYQFPIIKDASYILIARKASPWPLSNEDFAAKLNEFSKSSEWELIMDKSDILLFKRSE